MRYLVFGMGLVFWSGCGVEGLHNANPATRISADAGGFTFSNNKDVSVKLEEGSYDPATKMLVLKNLEIVDSASTVRNANVNQIDALGREALMIGQAYQAGFQGAAQMFQSLMPLANIGAGTTSITGPLGGNLTRTVPQAYVQPPASQPAATSPAP
jgi:hypothetical protein